MTAEKLQVGNVRQIQEVTDAKLAIKLLGMGIIPGSTIQKVRGVSQNAVFYFKINGSNYAFRKMEAASILTK